MRELSAQVAQIQAGAAPAQPLRWIRAQVGSTLRMIAVDEIDFLRSDSKYTMVAWRGDQGQPGEALVRTPHSRNCSANSMPRSSRRCTAPSW